MLTTELARTADRQARRRPAVERVAAGRSQEGVADFLGGHPVAVNQWVPAYRAAGTDGLAGTPHTQRTPSLSLNPVTRRT